MLNKNRLKSVIYGYEVRATAILSNGLVHKVPKQQTLKLVKKELGGLYLPVSAKTDLLKNRLWQDFYARYDRISKKTFSSLKKANSAEKGTIDYEEELKLRKNIVYKTVRTEFKQLEKIKNEAADEVEYRAKRDELQEIFASGIFYLCSSHKKPAKDHAEWEGKIYISEDWENRIDADMHGKIEAYVRNHDVKTVEWVTGEPVYLVTRPNCKHYFVEVSVEEVLGNSVRKLLKSHDMYMEEEKEISYEYGQYKNYYERLKMLKYMRRMFDAELLDKEIVETQKLVRKWGYRANGIE